MLKLTAISLLIVPNIFGQVSLTTAQIAKRVSPSVVVIRGKTDSGEVLGSGFIISKDGKIVTNLHVIRDVKAATVQLADGEVFDSMSVLGTDERRDLAVVHIGRIPPLPPGFTLDDERRGVGGFNLAPLEFGNSNSLTVGEPVVIVGSPRGLEGTVTAGILSSVRDSGEGFKVLQTDAAVNPGNSGGPLVNSKGQAIGVISFKLRSAEGLNFAIPITYVKALLNDLHEPMSFEQMRRSLSASVTSGRQGSGPSLKETLDWLKEKVPLAANHYIVELSGSPWESLMGRTKDVTLRTAATRFESCIIIFESTEVDVWEKYPRTPDVSTTRYTVPLGALTGGTVIKDNVTLSDSKQLETWSLLLHATSKVILRETHEGLKNTTKSESQNWVGMIFYEESIARRVLEAFTHAADLCRGKEPF